MTRRKKIISLLIALVIVFGALFVFPLTASAANVSIDSSLFTNTKNISIKGMDEGLALRVNQKEFAYTEYAATLPMDNFSMDFKTIDDNFETLVLTFSSMYDEKISNNYGLLNPSTDDIRKIIQPEKVKHIITFKKVSTGVSVNIKDGLDTGDGFDLGIIAGSGFKNVEFAVSYEVREVENELKGVYTIKSGTAYTRSYNSFAPIINDESNLRIDFPADSIKEIRKDTKDDEGKVTVDGAYTLLIKKISYLNINTSEQQTQVFAKDTTEDTSKPVLKITEKLGEKLLDSDEVFVPVNTQYRIPVYGLDVIKSSSTLTIRATVKYYENVDNEGNVTGEGEIILNNSTNLVFQVNKTGCYLIEKLTISDASSVGNEIVFEKDGNSLNGSGNTVITLPIKVTGVERTTDLSKSFVFNISDSYANLFDGIELKGGSNNKVVFPMPIVGSADFVSTNSTGIRSYVNGELEKPYNIMYELYYKHQDDSGDFVRYAGSSGSGLEFIATKTGTYLFKIGVLDDRQGNYKLCDTVIRLTFVDTEVPEITVNNFPEEVVVDQKFTIPTANVSDDFDTSTTRTIELYYLKKDGTKGDRIELKNGAFTPDKEMLDKEFIVIYNAMDHAITDVEGEGHKATTVERIFKVVKAKQNPNGPGFEMNTLSIIFLCLGGASLLGILALLFVKPKKKD